MITVTCDMCNKPMDIRSFNNSQTTVKFSYSVFHTPAVDGMPDAQDVCPHCAIVILQQLVAAWGG